MDYPDYSYPPGLFVTVARDILLLQHRSFREDAKACIEKINPPLRVLGKKISLSMGPVSLLRIIITAPGLGHSGWRLLLPPQSLRIYTG